MADDTERSVEIERIAPRRFRATNVRGGAIEFGDGSDTGFSPVELLLAAITGCTGLDVDYVTSRRAEPTSFQARARADKVGDAAGNHLTGIEVRYRIEFPSGQGGDAAREVLPSILQRSHDRLCTVSRTIELGTPVAVRLE